jgi:protein arginine kinase activator
MTCDRCGQREAVVNYIDIEAGIKKAQWLCEECAADVGLQLPGHEPLAGLGATGSGLHDFLGNSLNPTREIGEEPAASTALVCAACGYTFEQLTTTGLLGCPECYVVFREQLLPVLRRYHRATTHLGKAPHLRGPRAELRLEIARLRHALEAAVGREDYEEAARLRDVIRDRELELSRTARDGGADQES